MTQKSDLTCSDAIGIITAELTEPITLKEFTTRVLDIWHSEAKTPHANVRQIMRSEHEGTSLLFLDDEMVSSMALEMVGVQWRVRPSVEEISRGILYIDANFSNLRPRQIEPEALQLVDASNKPIPTRVLIRERKVEGVFGSSTYTLKGLSLSSWYKQHKLNRKDYVLITILDWATGKYRLEAEWHTAHRKIAAEVEKSNQRLADDLFDQLENSRREMLLARVTVPQVYARLKDQLDVPADHWLAIVEADGRMKWDGFHIRYVENRTLFDELLEEAHPQADQALPELTAEQHDQVYQFKAYLKHRKELWRRIEIQGGQDLQTFDDIMRDAFEFDTFEHLSGFWKRIRRGDSRRFREVDIATIYPFGGGGEGEGLRIADLDLQPDDQLKYVYDFGDWVECRIELEALLDAEEGAGYPRVVAQNKPKYKYCPECAAEGDKTVATYICIWCSSEAGEEVIMCDEHIAPEHEEHYLEEILY